MTAPTVALPSGAYDDAPDGTVVTVLTVPVSVSVGGHLAAPPATGPTRGRTASHGRHRPRRRSHGTGAAAAARLAVTSAVTVFVAVAALLVLVELTA